MINAASVWLDHIRQLDDLSCSKTIRSTKVVHLLLAKGRIGSEMAIVGMSFKDQRPFFVLPWPGRVLVDTTNTDYPEDLECPQAGREDIAYLFESLEHFSLKRIFPKETFLASTPVCVL